VNNVWVGGSYILAGGKMTQYDPAAGTTSDTKTSNTVLVDVTAYF